MIGRRPPPNVSSWTAYWQFGGGLALGDRRELEVLAGVLGGQQHHVDGLLLGQAGAAGL